MKVFLFGLLTLFIITNQRPVDCKDQTVQTVLEVLQKEDCKDLSICLSNCSEFLPNCPSRFDIILQDGTKEGNFFRGIEFEIPRNKTKYSEEAFQKTCVDKVFSTISKEIIEEFRDNIKKYMKILGINSERVYKLLKVVSWIWRGFGLPTGNKKFNLNTYLRGQVKVDLSKFESGYPFITKAQNQLTKNEKKDFELLYNTLQDDFIEKLRDYGRFKTFSDPVRKFIQIFFKRIGSDKENSIKEEYYGVEIYDIIDQWLQTFNNFQKICEMNDSRDVRVKKLKDFDEKMNKGDVPYFLGENSDFNKERDGKSHDFMKLLEYRDTIYHRITSKAVEKTKLCFCYSFEGYYKWKAQKLLDQGLDTMALDSERVNLLNTIKNRCKIECKRRKIILKEFEEKNKKTKYILQHPVISMNESIKVRPSKETRFH